MLSGMKFFFAYSTVLSDDVVKWNELGESEVLHGWDAGEVFRWWSRRRHLKNSLLWVVNGVKEQKAFFDSVEVKCQIFIMMILLRLKGRQNIN